MNRFLILIVAALTSANLWAADSPTSASSFGGKGYKWNQMTPEQTEIMKLSGDAKRGEQAYRACRGCHKVDGAGRIDGSYPRLTGQHAIVIIKQVTDTRAGIRSNEKMLPFANQHAVTLQEIADIATFLSTAVSELDNGYGPGLHVARGKRLYESRKCDTCHGKQGEGDEAKVYPVVAAQHYGYLEREMQMIRIGKRGNAHPDMVKSMKGLTTADIEAIGDYLSRLPDYRSAKRTP